MDGELLERALLDGELMDGELLDGEDGEQEEAKRQEERWAAFVAPSPGISAEREGLEEDFLFAMRRAGSNMQLFVQAAAERVGINATDLNCLNIVALTGQMTAGQLARATGLTTASITGVLDRLEDGGFIRRERDLRDRRRVIVNVKSGPGLREIVPTFGPLIKAWRATASRYTDEELRLILQFQAQVEQIMHDQLTRLRGEARGGGRAAR